MSMIFGGGSMALTAGDLPSGIDAAKLGAGTVSNTELATLDGVSSAIQTQLDSKTTLTRLSDITDGVEITNSSDEDEKLQITVDSSGNTLLAATGEVTVQSEAATDVVLKGGAYEFIRCDYSAALVKIGGSAGGGGIFGLQVGIFAEIPAASAPGNPASGARVYWDTAAAALRLKDSGGTVYSFDLTAV